MNNINECNNEELIELIKNGKITEVDLVNADICPFCFDRNNNHILYGTNNEEIIYEDDLFEVIRKENSNEKNYIELTVKKHYKYITVINDDVAKKMYNFATTLLSKMKTIYDPNNIYWITLCGDATNHYRIRFVPNYFKKNENNQTENNELEKEKIKILKKTLKNKNYK